VDSVIFNIDLDFFLDRTSNEAANTSRPGNNEYEVWTDFEVANFLKCQLGVDGTHKPPAFRCETHDEVLYACLRLCDARLLQNPFRLLHIDAHDDLDYFRDAIDAATAYCRTGARPNVEELEKSGTVNEANYACFMLALGMLSEYDFVHLEDSLAPSPSLFCQDEKSIAIPILEEPFRQYGEEYQVPASEIRLNIFSGQSKYITARACDDRLIENPIKARYRNWTKDHFFEKSKPAFLFVSRSPKYTPPKADRIIDEIMATLVDFERGERMLRSLGQKTKYHQPPLP